MKVHWFGAAAVAGLLAAFATVPVNAAEVLTLSATSGRFKIQGGFYPNYFVFLKGLDASAIDTAWVDKEYFAVLDILEGPAAGQSVIMTVKKSSERSPQPEWCATEGGAKFTGVGVTCLNGFDDYREQLRFKVKVKWADDKASLPAEFQDRVIAEYPELPGRGEGEMLGRFDLHIIKD